MFLYINETFQYHIGLVAQVVECRLGMAEAPGSNPGQSTKSFLRIIFKINYF